MSGRERRKFPRLVRSQGREEKAALSQAHLLQDQDHQEAHLLPHLLQGLVLDREGNDDRTQNQ